MQTLVSLFPDIEAADRAVKALLALEVDTTNIGVMTRTQQQAEQKERPAEEVAGSAGMGIAGGGVLGGVLGLLAGLGAVMIPGLGPTVVAGSLLTVLGLAGGGALFGAGLGGILGGLTGLAMPEEDASLYAEGIRRGGVLITASVAEELQPAVRQAFQDEGALDIQRLRQEWQEKGWKQFDPTNSNAGSNAASNDPDAPGWQRTQS